MRKNSSRNNKLKSPLES